MILWTIAATAAAVIVTVILIAYRRQVKTTCRHLAFLKKHKTNLRLGLSLPFSELNELVDGINEIIDQAREVERATQHSEDSLKETITNLSHDIRTPLTSMDGYFQLLAQSESEEERRHYIAIIQSRIGSLKDMLEEMFTYTKLQNNNYELSMEQIDFGKCVFDTVFSFYDDFQKKGIEPELDFQDGRMLINGNEEAVRRMLQNIIKNALDYGGSKIKLELLKEDSYTIFRCSNDVENAEEIDMSKVFVRFYKADTARTHSSTGLGLSIAKGLAERMGGTVTASMTESIFTIEVRMGTVPPPSF